MIEDKKYVDSIHRLGRLFTAAITIIVIAVPLTVCLAYDCLPDFSDVIGPMFTVMAAFLPTQCSEVVSFAPILGSASYVTFVTGNVQNLKLPVAISAQNVADVEQGTPLSDAISTMAVAISSIETIAIMALSVLLFVPLQPVLTSNAFSTMTKFVLPALYGSMAVGILTNFNIKKKGAKIIKNKLLIPVLPIILTFLAKLLIPSFSKIQSYFMVGLIIITIGWAFLLYKKGVVAQSVRE